MTTMSGWERFLIEKEGLKYDFSSVQFNLPTSIAEKVIEWAKKNISDADIFNTPDKRFGRENEIHVTALYGLHDDEATAVKKILESYKPFYISLGKLSIFKNPNFEVLKIEVTGPMLFELNKKLQELEHTTSHPVYKPHVTIAYMKKGTASQFKDNKEFDGESIKVDNLIFSSRLGRKTVIEL